MQITKNSSLFIYAFIFIGSFFAATQTLPQKFEFVSSIASVLLALPTFIAVIQLFGREKGLLIIACLGIFALVIENIAILTGLPYGSFYYHDQLGFKIGVVPWTVVFAWTPLLLGSMGFAHILLTTSKPPHFLKYLLLTCMLMVTTDLILDPGAVAMNFWQWRNPGWYYGVPIINFFGWVVSSIIGTFIFFRLEKNFLHQKISVALLSSWKYSLIFWTGIAWWEQLWIPLLVGIGLLIFVALKTDYRWE